ncbi:MAG: 4-hydroxy-tetrahydrodipicolinate reductase [Actinobacteria bacterium]|nr:4-hydroxy-tetrahydrodipicolinate reductase [Actinomycetota bacterium]
MKKIAVFGVCGKMGVAITGELLKEKDIKVVGGLDRVNIGTDMGEILGVGDTGVTVSGTYDDILKHKPDLIIDFTTAEAASRSINWAIDNKMDIIVGTTGISKTEINSFRERVEKSKNRVFLVPNFSIGAVVLMKIASMVTKYFDDCEIIEMHHDKKKDAPSGTSVLTAENISKIKKFNLRRLKDSETETLGGSRGAFYEGVHIHSVRLPGFLAHQEVIFGTVGQTLTIRHDSIDRLSFYPGVILAIRNIDSLSGFNYGLDKIISF